MGQLWWLFWMGVIIAGMGVWQLVTPLDVLWARQERYWQRRGLTPERTEVWEQGARRGGYAIIVLGVVLSVWIMVIIASAPVPMSGVSINGRALTQAEWDGCNHDTSVCLTRYYQPAGR